MPTGLANIDHIVVLIKAKLAAFLGRDEAE